MADAPSDTRGSKTIRVGAAEAGLRLDRLLADRLGVSRNRIQQWIRSGHVRVDGGPSKASHAVSPGEVLECRPPDPDPQRELTPEAGELAIVYQDDDLVVLDKPAGLVVHPGAGRSRGTLANRLLERFPETAEVGGPRRPGIVHRLDKDTTGLLVVARTQRSYWALSQAFARRQVEKRYLALVYGIPESRQGRIDRPIGRHPQERKRMAIRARGRPAVTEYRRLSSAVGISLLELTLETGRTHQIRVHLKSLGHPLIGDPTYGEARWRGLPGRAQAPLRRFARPALHAWRLRFAHPARDETMELEAPPPEDFRSLWQEVTGEPFPAGT